LNALDETLKLLINTERTAEIDPGVLKEKASGDFSTIEQNRDDRVGLSGALQVDLPI
jgi:hypothetical protein